MLQKFLEVLNILPLVVLLSTFVLAFLEYRGKQRFGLLLICFGAFLVSMAFLSSGLQYWAWDQSELTRGFLNTPMDATVPGWFAQLPVFSRLTMGYFLYYAFTRFWVDILLSLLSALVIYGLLTVLHRMRPRLLYEYEIPLGALMALLVGWPRVILFLPLVVGVALLLSGVQKLRGKEPYLPLGMPFFASAVLLLVLSPVFRLWLFEILGTI